MRPSPEVVPNTTEFPDAAADSVLINGSAGDDNFDITAGGANETTGRYTEIVVTRSSGGSTLYGITIVQSVRGEGDQMTIDSGAGNDILDASGLGTSSPDEGINRTNQIAVTLIAGEGNDRLVGTPFDDVLDGGVGSDTYTGGEGFDIFRDAQVQRIEHRATGGTFTLTFDGQTTRRDRLGRERRDGGDRARGALERRQRRA